MAATLPVREEAFIVESSVDISVETSSRDIRGTSVCREGIAGGGRSITIESLCDIIIGGLGRGLGVGDLLQG